MQKLLTFLHKIVPYLRFQWLANRFDTTRFVSVLSRGLGLIYFISLVSILIQFSDMFGVNGIDRATALQLSRYSEFFLLDLISSSLYGWLLVSIVVSILLIIGVFPFWCILFNTVVYCSIFVQSSTFMSFQWDILLMEASILSLLIISPKIRSLLRKQQFSAMYIQVLPLLLLLVRLFYQAGVIKLLSNDPLWATYKVLNIHLFSQPLPHLLSYYFHAFVIKNNLSTVFTQLMFLIELFVPFFLLVKAYRSIAVIILIGFQVLIMLTGNYGFFNVLVIGLLLPFLYLKDTESKPVLMHRYVRFGWCFLLGIVCYFSLNLVFLNRGHQPWFNTVRPVAITYQFMKRLSLFNGYGLFARMTTNQTKYTVFVSNDKQRWSPVHMKYFDKYGFPELSFIQPYQPRIRWQLWFKFIRLYNVPAWYERFIYNIAKNPLQMTSI
tara:strand:- start:35 stop:1345 length:1311 start_codon:yes stop_codon:yes gene_type:complete